MRPSATCTRSNSSSTFMLTPIVPHTNGHNSPHSPPSDNSPKVAEARKLVSELLSEGLVLLELQGPAYKRLATLR